MNPFATLIKQLVPDDAPKRTPHCQDTKALEDGIIALRKKGMAQNAIANHMRCTGTVVGKILKRHGMNSYEWLRRQTLATQPTKQEGQL